LNNKRVKVLKTSELKPGPVIYWMSRDQRVRDNWALIYAQQLAHKAKKPLIVVFCLAPKFLGATIRQYGFMLRGLKEVEIELAKLNIKFILLKGNPEIEIPKFSKSVKAESIITDFDPLKIKRKWKQKIKQKINCSLYEVDAHNIVPCWITSDKQDYGAYTIRPKIRRQLPEFLEKFPTLRKHPYKFHKKSITFNLNNLFKSLKVDIKVPEVSWIKPGEKAAIKAMKKFIKDRLSRYEKDRNDPNKNGQSNLSPYIHFGQLSAQRLAYEVKKSNAPLSAKKAFLEELIVRRELSDNYCYYNNDYDSFIGFPNWAKETLNTHKKDIRDYIYTKNQFEKAKTHDDLWNAAQMEMVKTGKMHGYMRMYWAKKILEWTRTPEEAIKIAIYLNDKYELDGRDPNGYCGIAWSIGGLHDRAWGKREIFGKVRYMSRSGCANKFDIRKYITRNCE
jgi:deoxyribodipyrimidine photo-lyase